MDLYIDKENIDSFISFREHPLYGDCLKTMQKKLNVYFNFTKEELVKNEGLLAWFKFFTSGVGKNNKQIFNEIIFPERALKSNTYTSFTKEQLSSIYLISDEKTEVLKEKGAVLIGHPGEEIEIFNQVFLFQEDYKFDKKLRIGSPEFNKWTDLVSYSSAVSDILFFDPYILSEPAAIDDNFIPFLQALLAKSRCKINLVLYVNLDQVNIEYADISARVRKGVESVTGIKPNFTLVKVRDQRGVDSSAEHDRTVFTNYIRVYSGDTFNYFKSNGSKLTKGREVHFSSYGDSDNHNLALELIKDIQDNLDRLPPEIAEADKKSNFLNFK